MQTPRKDPSSRNGAPEVLNQIMTTGSYERCRCFICRFVLCALVGSLCYPNILVQSTKSKRHQDGTNEEQTAEDEQLPTVHLKFLQCQPENYEIQEKGLASGVYVLKSHILKSHRPSAPVFPQTAESCGVFGQLSSGVVRCNSKVGLRRVPGVPGRLGLPDTWLAHTSTFVGVGGLGWLDGDGVRRSRAHIR